MIRPVYIYGGVLIASLAVAWMRYTAEPTADLTDKILLLQGDAEDITQVTWRDEDEHAIIDRRSDDHGSFLWVSYTKTVEVTPTPDLPEEEDVPAEEGEDAPAEEPVVE
ncbi:MAG: hypothetical protein ACI8S6_002625, partial [Myxococcota bacterium]